MGRPSVYPTGTTIYDRNRCWNGYTLFKTNEDALLIDMNGNLVRHWKGLGGMPHKLLPGGFVMGSTGIRDPKNSYQDNLDLVQCDFDGNIVWSFDKNEYLQDPGMEEPNWMLRQHHDYQREGSTTGYYYPGAAPKIDGGNTIILTHTNVRRADISDKLLIDDRVIEVTWKGEIIWEWKISDHFDELGFSPDAKRAIYRDPTTQYFEKLEDAGDWVHVNSCSVLGENRWYDAGDGRFHPDNLIMDCREANIIFIVDKETGKLVWKLGPDFQSSDELIEIGQIIGQHHCHMIPRGLPGGGNILIFDNGGLAGYSAGTPGSPDGTLTARRHYSRVIEIDPVKMKIVWQYPKVRRGLLGEAMAGEFFSCLVSSAQRLPNGNTMICEGLDGRIFKVTAENEIVWEYVSPYCAVIGDGVKLKHGNIYRAYRYPYEWVPQLPKPEEKSVVPPDNSSFKVPGAQSDWEIGPTTVEVKLQGEKLNEKRT